jgi:hypothetical protein
LLTGFINFHSATTGSFLYLAREKTYTLFNPLVNVGFLIILAAQGQKRKFGMLNERMNRTRPLYFALGLTFVVIGFVLKAIYRPYANANEIKDLGIANSSPSLLYVIGFSLLLSINARFNVIYVTMVVTVGSLLYEIRQYFDHDKFDISDAIYSIIGGFLTILIHFSLKNKHNRVKGFARVD